MPQLTPEELNELLGRLAEVESEARNLRTEIEQRLLDHRRGDMQDRSGQPKAKAARKRA